MARIGKKQAAQILRRVVAKHGADITYADRDGRYEKSNGCRYVNGKGAPMCIVGVALVEFLGVDPKLLKERNTKSVTALFPDILPDPGQTLYGLPEIQALLTPDAAHVFQAAQDKQDYGVSWGEAVKVATAGIR